MSKRPSGCPGLSGARHLVGCSEAGRKQSGTRLSRAERQAAGQQSVEVWFLKEEVPHLDALAEEHGGRSSAIRVAVEQMPLGKR